MAGCDLPAKLDTNIMLIFGICDHTNISSSKQRWIGFIYIINQDN